MNMRSDSPYIEPAEGRLGVLLPGLGAVGTTFMAGVYAIRKDVAPPIGSVAQMGRISDQGNNPLLSEALPLADLDDLVFGGWDIFEQNCYEAAKQAGVLSDEHLNAVEDELASVDPMEAVFDPNFVRNLEGPNVKSQANKMDLASALIEDIENFVARNECSRAVAVWCGSTEVHVPIEDVHKDLEAFEQGLKNDHDAISPTMIYAYAHLKAGVPFLNGAPNRAMDCPALIELAEREGVPVGGKDFKTGQTLLKTILAPGLEARKLGVQGWYSTNILGNRDGAVLDDPGSFRSKEESKLSVLESILSPDQNPELYGDMNHKVSIDYYPPRGDNKEGWDNVDITGWMGYPMQIKMNFLCRDSILAAPVALDAALFADLANRAGESGIQEWLSFYFKSPHTKQPEVEPVHDLFRQQDLLMSRLKGYLQRVAV